MPRCYGGNAVLEPASEHLPYHLYPLLSTSASKFYNWPERYRKVNEHNGWVPRDFWLEDWEKQAVLGFLRRQAGAMAVQVWWPQIAVEYSRQPRFHRHREVAVPGPSELRADSRRVLHRRGLEKN